MSTEISTPHLLAELKQVLTCPMCRKIMVDPAIVTSCQHCFCFACINFGIERGCVPCDISWDPVVHKRRRLASKKVTFQCPACGQAAYKWMLQRVPTLSSFLDRVRDAMERFVAPAETGLAAEPSILGQSGSGEEKPSASRDPVADDDHAQKPHFPDVGVAEDQVRQNLPLPLPATQSSSGANPVTAPPIPESAASSVLLFEESCNLWPVDGGADAPASQSDVAIAAAAEPIANVAPSSSLSAAATTCGTVVLTAASTVELASTAQSCVASAGLALPHAEHSKPAEWNESSLVGFVRTPPALASELPCAHDDNEGGGDRGETELNREASSNVALPAAAPLRLTESLPKASPIRGVPTLVSVAIDSSVWNSDGGPVARNKYEQLLILATRKLNGALLQINTLSRTSEALEGASLNSCLRVDVRHASHCVCLLDQEMFATRNTAAQCDILLSRVHYHLDALIVGLQWAVACIELGRWLSPAESARFACKSHTVQYQALLGMMTTSGFVGVPGASSSNLPLRAITVVVHVRVATLQSLLAPEQNSIRREMASAARLALRFGANQVWIHVDGEDDGQQRWLEALPLSDDSTTPSDLVRSLFSDDREGEPPRSAALFVVSVVSKSVKDGAARITTVHPEAPLPFRQRLQAKDTHVVRRSVQWWYDRIAQDPTAFAEFCASMRSGDVSEWENQRPRGSARAFLLGQH